MIVIITARHVIVQCVLYACHEVMWTLCSDVSVIDRVFVRPRSLLSDETMRLLTNSPRPAPMMPNCSYLLV